MHAASGTVIESSGATSLVLADNTYHFGSATGPQLRYNGSAVVVGQFGNASPIAVEQKGSGYQVAWKVSGADLFNVWNTDSNGNFQSYTPGVSGNSCGTEVVRNELPAGSQRRWSDRPCRNRRRHRSVWRDQPRACRQYLPFGRASGLQLKYNGSAVVVGQFGHASPIAVEQKGSGYQVAWKVSGADLFNVWNTDSNGNFQSFTPGVSGNSAALKSFETSFQQDLNGDGVIGTAQQAS